MEIKNYVKKILKDTLQILKGEEEIGGGEIFLEELTNQKLVDEIFGTYKKCFKKETVEQEMLFPTCFRIYLHSEDFEDRKDAFSTVSLAMANKLNAFNRAEMHKYKKNKPKSLVWLFQFIEFRNGNTTVKDIENLEKGKIYTMATLFSENFSTHNISNEGNVKVTKSGKESNNPVEMYNYNLEAFRGMDMLGRNRFRIPIRPNYEDATDSPESDDATPDNEKKALAYLICDKNFIRDDGKTSNKYPITSNHIHISGKDDTRKGEIYAKVNDTLPDSIVHIRHNSGNFELAAFGKVRLNEVLVPESKGGNIQWAGLSDNSAMLIADNVSITFKKQKPQ